MTLFAETPQGAAYIAHQHLIALACKKAWGCTDCIETRGKSGAIIDAHLGHDGISVAVIEVKTRPGTLKHQRGYPDVLFTEKKIQNGIRLSRDLKTPFYMVLGFEASPLVCWWQVSNEEGEKVMTWELVENERVWQPIGRFYEYQDSAHFPYDNMHVFDSSKN